MMIAMMDPSLAQLAAAPGGGVTVLETILAGGGIGYLIIGLSFVAVVFIVAHAIRIREVSLAPPESLESLHELLGEGDIQGAITHCEDEDHDSFLTRVVRTGLIRAQRSPFGNLELRTALEEAGRAEVARLYRSTDALGLIAGIAPMLGLLGTVVGMVGAFDTIASSEGFARPDQLAGNISTALVTTLMGLTLAIPCMAAFTYFRNRIDALVGRVGESIEELAEHVESGAGEREKRAPAPGATTGAPTARGAAR